jgi:uncharacterized protein (UPF0332 family)
MRQASRDQLMAKARTTLDAAQVLLREGYPADAISRAYYAVFHATSALLADKGLAFSSHQAVIAAFGKEYAKTGQLDPELHRVLRVGFEDRQIADYDATAAVTIEEAEKLVDYAEQFLDVAARTLGTPEDK